MKKQVDNFSSNTCSVSGEQISSIFFFEKRAQITSSFQWPLCTKIPFPSPQSLIPLGRIVFVTSSKFWDGYQYLTYILGLGINIGPNFWDWVVTEIVDALTPYEFIVKIHSEVPPPPPMVCTCACIRSPVDHLGLNFIMKKSIAEAKFVLYSEQNKSQHHVRPEVDYSNTTLASKA